MNMQNIMIWLIVGIICYLTMWVYNFITDKHYGQKMKKVYLENGLFPFFKGILLILLGPLLIFLFIGSFFTKTK